MKISRNSLGLAGALVALLTVFIGRAEASDAVGVLEFRGSTRKVSDSCGNGPDSLPLNMRLSWANYFYFVAKDRTFGITVDGYPARNGPFLDGEFPLTNGGKMLVGYSFIGLDKRRGTARLEQLYIFQYPGWVCSRRYVGSVRGR